jgi:broad specificity phosphatase PhoE
MSKLNITSHTNDLIKITKNILDPNKFGKKLIFVRSCENMGSLSGCLTGWLDAKLSEYGRKQAKYLSIEYFANFNSKQFSNFYVSDLVRAKETAEMCMGYDTDINYQILPELREINFGDKEGYFYDGLPKEEKEKLNKINNKFSSGESWLDVKYRCIKFLSTMSYLDEKTPSDKKNNVDLLFTHGGFITSFLYTKSIKSLPPNGSVIIVSLSENLEEDQGKIKSLLNEFSKLYNCPDENYNDVLFNKYNPCFEEYLDKSVKDVELVYNLPDLTEELL